MTDSGKHFAPALTPRRGPPSVTCKITNARRLNSCIQTLVHKKHDTISGILQTLRILEDAFSLYDTLFKAGEHAYASQRNGFCNLMSASIMKWACLIKTKPFPLSHWKGSCYTESKMDAMMVGNPSLKPQKGSLTVSIYCHRAFPLHGCRSFPICKYPIDGTWLFLLDEPKRKIPYLRIHHQNKSPANAGLDMVHFRRQSVFLIKACLSYLCMPVREAISWRHVWT